MGFAVVADEVRNLAHRCATAAQETASLIEESIARSKDGRARVDEVAGLIGVITEDAARVKTLVDELSRGGEEQVRGIEQISQAIVHMNQAAQNTAAGAEQSSLAGRELSAQSEALKGFVQQLTTLVSGT
jgi:methyl-accepting chemotaxis protein/methyl-accepting chemotaxis protein-1 (serine sensor receptor)